MDATLYGDPQYDHRVEMDRSRCINLLPIESLPQYRFATLKPLKARPSGVLHNRSFVQPRRGGDPRRCSSPLSLINSESPRLGPEPSRARSEAKPIP